MQSKHQNLKSKICDPKPKIVNLKFWEITETRSPGCKPEEIMHASESQTTASSLNLTEGEHSTSDIFPIKAVSDINFGNFVAAMESIERNRTSSTSSPFLPHLRVDGFRDDGGRLELADEFFDFFPIREPKPSSLIG